MRPIHIANRPASRTSATVAALLLVAALILILGWCLRRPRTVPELPRVSAGDVTFEGAYPVPTAQPTNGDTDLSFGGQGLSVAPDGQSLTFGCHSPLAYARISIPTATAPARLLTRCVWVPETPGDGAHIGGLVETGGRIVVSKYVFYDGSGAAWYTHQFSDDSGKTWSPLMRVGAYAPNGSWLNAGFTAGYMGLVPGEWRAALGAPAFTGQGVLSIISRTSSGPAAFGFDPATLDEGLTAGETRAASWLYYPLDAPLANPDTTNELFTRADRLAGAAFIPGTSTFLVVGSHGMGPTCYGSGTANKDEAGTPGADGMMRCYDPTDGAQGEHNFPYRLQAWAYDAADFARVLAGDAAPWELRPYAVFPLTVPGVDPDAYKVRRGGAAFDAATGRLFVSPDSGELPRLDVFHVAAGTVPPEPPIPTGPCTVAAVTKTPTAVLLTMRCEATR